MVGERGGSTVEMALLAPVLAALVLYGAHLAELGVLRVRQQEVARYVAWELTARQLSDLDGADHPRRFALARNEVIDEAAHRYRDLQGHERSGRDLAGLATAARIGPIAVERAGLDARAGLPRGGGVTGKVLNVMGRSLDLALGDAFGMNVGGATAEVSVPLRVESKLSGTGGILLEGPLLPERLRVVELAPARMRLGVDTFYLDDGRDVHLPGGGGGEGYRFWRQVQRMHLLARARRQMLGPADAAVRAAEKLLPLRFITEAQVVAQVYTDPDRDPSRLRCPSRRPVVTTGAWRNGVLGHGGPTPPDGMSAEKCFDTLPLQAWGTARGYDRDPAFRTLHARRDRYLGCPAHEGGGDCTAQERTGPGGP